LILTDFDEQKWGLRGGCSWNSYMFNMFLDDIMDYINKSNSCTKRKNDNINSLKKAICQTVKYCRDWNPICNLNKYKILVFKKEGDWRKKRDGPHMIIK